MTHFRCREAVCAKPWMVTDFCLSTTKPTPSQYLGRAEAWVRPLIYSYGGLKPYITKCPLSGGQQSKGLLYAVDATCITHTTLYKGRTWSLPLHWAGGTLRMSSTRQLTVVWRLRSSRSVCSSDLYFFL